MYLPFLCIVYEETRKERLRTSNVGERECDVAYYAPMGAYASDTIDALLQCRVGADTPTETLRAHLAMLLRIRIFV